MQPGQGWGLGSGPSLVVSVPPISIPSQLQALRERSDRTGGNGFKLKMVSLG